jgi:hypothetical protein
LRIDRQSSDGIFAVLTADLTVFVENFTFMNTSGPAIPGTNLTEIFTLGLQAHNTTFHGVLHYESTNGFAARRNSSPAVLYFESTRPHARFFVAFPFKDWFIKSIHPFTGARAG